MARGDSGPSQESPLSQVAALRTPSHSELRICSLKRQDLEVGETKSTIRPDSITIWDSQAGISTREDKNCRLYPWDLLGDVTGIPGWWEVIPTESPEERTRDALCLDYGLQCVAEIFLPFPGTWEGPAFLASWSRCFLMRGSPHLLPDFTFSSV